MFRLSHLHLLGEHHVDELVEGLVEGVEDALHLDQRLVRRVLAPVRAQLQTVHHLKKGRGVEFKHCILGVCMAVLYARATIFGLHCYNLSVLRDILVIHITSIVYLEH